MLNQTVAIIGHLEASVNLIVYDLAQHLSKDGQVVAGDYLDKKKISNNTELFHLGYYAPNRTIDLINCPIRSDNVAIAVNQARQIVWVIAPDKLTGSLHNSIAAASYMGIKTHHVVLNVTADILSDEDLMEVSKLEVAELFGEFNITPKSVLSISINSLQDVENAQAQLANLVDIIKSDNVPNQIDSTNKVMYIERCYEVSHMGKPARIAFGAITSGTIAVGDVLQVVGLDENIIDVRIGDIQQFGNQVRTASSGVSVAALILSAPKGFPKVGQIITNAPDDFQITNEIKMTFHVPKSRSATKVLGGIAGVDVYIGSFSTSANIVSFEPADKENQAHLVLHLQKKAPLVHNQIVILGSGTELLALGK